MGLDQQGGDLGVNPGGDVESGHLASLVGKLLGVVGLAEGVQVNNAEEVLELVLLQHPGTQRS